MQLSCVTLFCNYLVIDLIQFCWGKIPSLHQYEATGDKIIILDVDDALHGELYRSVNQKPLIETSLAPSATTPDSARPNHNSLTTDDKTPTVPHSEHPANTLSSLCHSDIQSIPVYNSFVWPYLLGLTTSNSDPI
jgi:hypothetical protein